MTLRARRIKTPRDLLTAHGIGWGGRRWTRGRWKFYFDWSFDNLPWPRAGAIRCGDHVEVHASFGPLHADPVLAVAVDFPRPR